MALGWIILALVIFVFVIVLFRTMNQVYLVALFKKNFFWIFFIAILLFFSFSVYHIHANYDIDFTTYEGFSSAGKIYFIWVKSVFANLGKITGYAVNQNWFLNSTG
jgi:hypothetical protein